MIFVFWRGRGYWAVFLVTAAMFLPMIVLRQVDGPAVDRGVAAAMALAAAAVAWLGYRWNQTQSPGLPAEHSFWGLPMQYWALPMLVFALLLGTGTITTAE